MGDNFAENMGLLQSAVGRLLDFGTRPAYKIERALYALRGHGHWLYFLGGPFKFFERDHMSGILKALTLSGLLALVPQFVRAQAMAEAGALTSHSGITSQSASAAAPAIAKTANESASPHLPVRTGPPPNEVNRKNFEDNAGENAGKLLLRSVPSGAEIFINDLLVGRTPMFLVIAPGKYKVDMRGPRAESGHSNVGVMPKETQTVVVNLTKRYPASVTTH